MKRVYIIQYRNSCREDECAETYKIAKAWLAKQGYTVETQSLSEEENSTGCYESPEDGFFGKAEARILSRNLIDFNISDHKACEMCGKEMDKYNRNGAEFKICSGCAAKLPEDPGVKAMWESIGCGELKSDQL